MRHNRLFGRLKRTLVRTATGLERRVGVRVAVRVQRTRFWFGPGWACTVYRGPAMSVHFLAGSRSLLQSVRDAHRFGGVQ